MKYPDNLNLKDALYFTFVPTYCYDMNIKKDDHFKWMDLIVQVGHFLLGAEAMLNILDHLITPQLADFYEDPGFLQFYGFKHFLHCTAKASLLAVSMLKCKNFKLDIRKTVRHVKSMKSKSVQLET